ncbi:MAG: hypothetical protein LBG44_10045 [Gemmatimonadota bacterium]|nr:hypothetical protein [Gemmatimonadota bacterium]
MADPSEAFSTLDDFLLSLADGVSHAQQELSRSGLHGEPGRQFAYHLPRVDFELKMNLRVVQDSKLTNRYKSIRALNLANKHLLFRPLASEETSTLEIAAVVRGAFVAVPANNGLPAPVIELTVVREDPNAPVVQVTARNMAGEALVGAEVQFNIDREESFDISAAAGRTMTVAAGTRFDRASVLTDADGKAEAVLTIASDQARGLLAITVDVADQTETLVYEVAS